MEILWVLKKINFPIEFDYVKYVGFSSLAVSFVLLGLYIRHQKNEAIQIAQIASETLSIFANKQEKKSTTSSPLHNNL